MESTSNSSSLTITAAPASDSRQESPRPDYETLIGSEDAKAALERIPRPFRVESTGVYGFIELRKGEIECRRLSAPLVVVAKARKSQGGGWSKLVRFLDHDGQFRELVISDADLTTKATRVLADLADLGLEITAGTREQQALVELLRKWEPAERITLVTSIGWTDTNCSAFVLADGKVIANDAVRLTPGVVDISSNAAVARGELAGWRENVAGLCPGNALMITAVSLGFAAPLLQVLGLEGSGLHLYGGTSNGKTTLQHLAYSVWRDPTNLPTWNATRVGLEELAASHSGTLLVLNELAEADPATIGETIYALTNGQRRRRHRSSNRRNSPEAWCLCTLSSGEITLAEKIVQGGGRLMGGHEVRMLQVRADKQRYGVFDELHGIGSPTTFAEEIKRRVTADYGTAGPAFVSALIGMLDAPTARAKLLRTLESVARKLLADHQRHQDPKTLRAVRLFAAVTVAGELATRVGLTGWTKGTVLEAVSQVTRLWEVETNSSNAGDVAADACRIDEFINANPTKFAPPGDSTASAGGAEAGWIDKDRIYFPPKVWAEIHSGCDARHIARKMAHLGILVSNNGSGLTSRMPSSVPGRPHVYVIERAKLEGALRSIADREARPRNSDRSD